MKASITNEILDYIMEIRVRKKMYRGVIISIDTSNINKYNN